MREATDNRRAVLFVGNYRPTIPLCREMRALGFETIVGVTDQAERGFAVSRFVSERWTHPCPETEPGQFLAALDRFVRSRADIANVIPVSEHVVKLLSAQRSRLYRGDIYVMAGAGLIGLCLDKERILRAAEAAGVSQAPFRVVGTLEEMAVAAREIGFPLVVRPVDPIMKFGARKILTVSDPTMLEAVLPMWPEGHERLIVQAHVAGRRHNLYFAAERGRMFRLAEVVTDRTNRYDGSGLAVAGRTVAPTPGLRRQTEALLETIGYTGIGCAQFLVDPRSGRSSFLEINPRIAGNHAIPFKAGLGLGAAMMDLHAGSPAGPLRLGTPGLRYAWSYGDFGGLAREIGAGRIGVAEAAAWASAAAGNAMTADFHLVWAWDDPAPAIEEILARAGAAARSVFSRIGARRRPPTRAVSAS